MIHQFLKIAKVKDNKEFYAKYPNEAAFFKAHPEAKDLKTMAKGGSVNKNDQLSQLIQMYAQISKQDPNAIMKQIQGMKPKDQQSAIQHIAQTVQQASQQQSQPSPQQQPQQQNSPEYQPQPQQGAQQPQMMIGGQLPYHIPNELIMPHLQNGGRLPIYTNNPNDPKLKAYSDSLNLYNQGERAKPIYQDYVDTHKNGLSKGKYNPFAIRSSQYMGGNTIQPIKTEYVLGQGRQLGNMGDPSYQLITNPNQQNHVYNDLSVPLGKFRESDGHYNNMSGVDNTIPPLREYKKPVQPIMYQPQHQDIYLNLPSNKTNKIVKQQEQSKSLTPGQIVPSKLNIDKSNAPQQVPNQQMSTQQPYQEFGAKSMYGADNHYLGTPVNVNQGIRLRDSNGDYIGNPISKDEYNQYGTTDASLRDRFLPQQQSGGVMYGNYQLPQAQWGTNIDWTKKPEQSYPNIPFTNSQSIRNTQGYIDSQNIDYGVEDPSNQQNNEMINKTIQGNPNNLVPIDNTSGMLAHKDSIPDKKPNNNGISGVEAAGLFVGGMDMFANGLERNNSNSIAKNWMTQQGTTNGSFDPINPTNARGSWEGNTSQYRPDKQVVTQFANQNYKSQYGQPMMESGGSMLPDIITDASLDSGISPNQNSIADSPSLPPMSNGVNNNQAPIIQHPENINSFIETGSNNSNNSSSDNKSNFMLYMSHQQGLTGIKAISKAADTGRSWKDFYKGTANLDRNMKSNITQDEFYKKYDNLNPTTFIDYWKNKFSNNESKYANKTTKFDNVINQLAPQYGFTPQYIKTVIGTESNFNPNNVTGSYKGLFQIGPDEAKKLGITDIYDPYQNIVGGLKLLASNKSQLNKQGITRYKEGGSYDLSNEEINRLKAQGYELDIQE